MSLPTKTTPTLQEVTDKELEHVTGGYAQAGGVVVEIPTGHACLSGSDPNVNQSLYAASLVD